MAAHLTSDMPGSPANSVCSEVRNEELWREGGEALSLWNVSQKVLEKKEQQLRECIEENYSQIRDVEKELEELQLQLKLTAGPKKLALEMLRKKIESQNEVVVTARARHSAAQRFIALTEKELAEAESRKEQLCSELNMLVQHSAKNQLEKLQQLSSRLDMLTLGKGESEQTDSAPDCKAQSANADVQDRKLEHRSESEPDLRGPPQRHHAQKHEGMLDSTSRASRVTPPRRVQTQRKAPVRTSRGQKFSGFEL